MGPNAGGAKPDPVRVVFCPGERSLKSMEANPLAKMMNPNSVAVYGASENAESVGGRVFANLVADGFEGKIFPINPKHKKVGGLPCYPSVLDIGEEVANGSVELFDSAAYEALTQS